jgi:hypothetical protein
MGLFNFFKKKEQEPERTSFEVRYELVLKDNIDEQSRGKAINTCSEKKFVDDESERECRVCLKLLSEDRLWTRTGIENLSQKLGYSVYDNPGGGCDENCVPVCACEWKSKTVIKKNQND